MVAESLGERLHARPSRGRKKEYGNTQREMRIADRRRAALTSSHCAQTGRSRNLWIRLIANFNQTACQELVGQTIDVGFAPLVRDIVFF